MQDANNSEPSLGFPATTVPQAEHESNPAIPASDAPQQDAVEQAKQGVNSLVAQAKEQVAGKAASGKEGLADQIEDLADTVQRSGQQFAGKQDWIAQAIDGGAQELTSLAQALRQNDLGSLLSQVQSFAKRQPGVFVGASLAAGFAIARLGKVVVAEVSRDDLPTMPEVGNGQR